MSATTAGTDGSEAVVGSDGALTVAAAERVSRPASGAHPPLIPAWQPEAERNLTAAGALAGQVPVEAVEELLQSLDDVKAERAARYGRTAGQS